MTRRMQFTALCATLLALAPAAASAQATTQPKAAAKPVAKPAPKKEESQAALQKEAKVSLADATATAQKEVPTGKIQSHELEREDGKLIYSFDIKIAGKSGIEEVNIDAMTGAVVAKEHEDPKDEAKEKAEDAAKKKAAAAPKKGGGGL